jgi:hypothetical protein
MLSTEEIFYFKEIGPFITRLVFTLEAAPGSLVRSWTHLSLVI